jgi:hypothetical protein
MNREELIEKNSSIFWYFDKSKLSEMSDAVLVEFILNYGDLEAVKELFSTLGKEKAAQIFAQSIKSKRDNYLPLVKNFFDLYFKRNVPEYPF